MALSSSSHFSECFPRNKQRSRKPTKMATDYAVNTDRLRNFFNELDTRKALLTTITQLHKTLTDHFASLEHSLSEKSKALDSEIETFDARTKKTIESLENRENTIPERESAAAARIEEQWEAAISDIEKAESGGEAGGVGDGDLSEVLRMYCRRMNSKGLVRYLLTKRKESAALRTEIAAAVEESVDAMRLVLDAVEEYVEMKAEGKAGMADRRWACGILVQAAVPVGERGSGGGGIARSVRERAAAVVGKWKGMMGGGEGGGVGAGEATMLLQMVVGFGLKEKFDEEYLRKLVLEFATRRDMAKLAVALGFGEKMKDIIAELVKTGKEIEAVNFAFESGLTDQFSPVALLRTNLKNCRKNAHHISKNGKFSTAAVDEANNSELNTSKGVIKCVEDHKLESQFNLDGLKKRVVQLEKAKAERKKGTASTSKPSNKRTHGGGGRGGGPSYRPPKATRFSNVSPSFRQRNPSQPHQAAAGRFPTAYNYSSPGMYESPGAGAATYGPGYGAAYTQSPAALSQQYHPFASQDIGATGARVGGGTYGGEGLYGGQTNYGTYDYSAAGGPGYPPYPQ